MGPLVPLAVEHLYVPSFEPGSRRQLVSIKHRGAGSPTAHGHRGALAEGAATAAAPQLGGQPDLARVLPQYTAFAWFCTDFRCFNLLE